MLTATKQSNGQTASSLIGCHYHTLHIHCTKISSTIIIALYYNHTMILGLEELIEQYYYSPYTFCSNMLSHRGF